MALNFGSLKSVSVSTVNYLRPWNIYDNVKFEGITGPTTGTSANGRNWARYEMKFSCPEGVYIHSFFEPQSNEQRSFSNEGGNSYTASDLENVLNLLALVGTTFNKEGFAKVQEKASLCGDDFDKLIKLFNKCVGTPETTTSMKLAGRNNDGSVYATFPRWSAISVKKENLEHPELAWDAEDNHYQTFIPKNCVFGNNLGWSSYEIGKVKEYNSATPTPQVAKSAEKSENDSSEIDDLLGDL